MEIEISKQSSENGAVQPSLTKVLVQSEHIENPVKESVEELSSVNAESGFAVGTRRCA
jgi:hypothetical protein